MFTRLTLLLIFAALTVPIAVAQTKKQTTHTQMNQPTGKVSMRQMGMGKMKNNERWKAAIARANHRADHLRKHGKGVK
jgi:uncharacterized membrane protein YdfJ with MMPL/SSD domain